MNDVMRVISEYEMEKRVRKAAEERMRFNIKGSVKKVEEDCVEIVFEKVSNFYAS